MAVAEGFGAWHSETHSNLPGYGTLSASLRKAGRSRLLSSAPHPSMGPITIWIKR